MSQGDYIRYKRVANELVEQSKLAPVLYSSQYTNYKEFKIENTVFNNNPTYVNLNQTNASVVFGITRRNAASCPSFILCNGTNARPNRKVLMGVQSDAQPLATPKIHMTPNKLMLCSYC